MNDELTSCIKEYIIDTYKHLIENMHKMHPHEVNEESIDLREYIDVLNLKELKECYLWERKFKEALENEINDSLYFLEYFKNVEPNSNISDDDKEFYELFTRDIEFELARKPILNTINKAKKKLEKKENLSEEETNELISVIEENKIKLEELYEEYRKYYQDRPYNKWGLKAKEKLHNTLLAIMSTTLSFDIDVDREDAEEPEFCDEKNLANEEFIEDKTKEYFEKTLFERFKAPAIYAANHTNVHDVPTICKAIEDHVHIIAGDEVRNDVNGLMFKLNGVDWVARADEKSRFLAKEASIRRTINQIMYMYLPEGTWNMTESDPMLPFNWGIIDNAQKSGLPIIPVVLEYTKEVCYVKIGTPMYVSIFDDKLEAINKLRDTMSTMRWDFWEALSMDMFTKKQQENKKILQKLGMEFIPEDKFLSWSEWVKLLNRFIEHHRTLDIPTNFKTKDGINFDRDGYDLRKWLNSQKTELGHDNLSYTQELRKQELLNLGVIIEPVVEEYTCDEMLEIAMKYKEEHGNLNVRRTLIVAEGSCCESLIRYPLGEFINQQKYELSRKGEWMTKEEFYRDVIEASLKEYPKLNSKFEESVIFRPYPMNEIVFAHLNNLEINKNNVWLYEKNYWGTKSELAKENYFNYLEKEIELKRSRVL